MTSEDAARFGIDNPSGYMISPEGRPMQINRSPLVQVGGASDTYTDGRNEQFAALMGDIEEGERAAISTMTNLDSMEMLMNDPNFYSGAGSNIVAGLQRVAQGMGLSEPGQVSSYEAFKGQVNRAALDQMGGSLGAGFSNADRDFVVNQVPNTEFTPEGNLQLIEILRKIQGRRLEIAQLARSYEAQHGQIDSNFNSMIAHWAAQNPLFDRTATPNAVPPPPNLPAELQDEWPDLAPYITQEDLRTFQRGGGA